LHIERETHTQTLVTASAHLSYSPFAKDESSPFAPSESELKVEFSIESLFSGARFSFTDPCDELSVYLWCVFERDMKKMEKKLANEEKKQK